MPTSSLPAAQGDIAIPSMPDVYAFAEDVWAEAALPTVVRLQGLPEETVEWIRNEWEPPPPHLAAAQQGRGTPRAPSSFGRWADYRSKFVAVPDANRKRYYPLDWQCSTIVVWMLKKAIERT